MNVDFKVTVLYAGELNIFHRMIEDGRHLWKASNPSSSKDTQSRMCQITSSQVWCLQGWELHSLCGELLPALNHKELFSWCPLSPVLSWALPGRVFFSESQYPIVKHIDLVTVIRS